ncbi:MAG: N-6 DNA methylase [Candidatus Edwardsbacteria bacterium]|nr:N-6 DNA methylase [Candidatus Edwardsbacteria bacterium]
MSQLKAVLQALVAQAKTRGLSNLSEEHIQGGYTVKVLEALGWNDGGWIINSSQEHTGKRPDIILKDAKGWTMLVVESKDASSADKLDGSYGTGKYKKPFVSQLADYCKAEGVYWGILTNFIEWRVYSAYQGRLYPQNKKYAFHDLLWDDADKNSYVNLLSKEGLEFLSQFSRQALCKKLGKIDDDFVYYPEEKQVRDDFFAKLKGWREALRDELWVKNQHLVSDKEKIELYTQKLLDRMIFMDVCYDKKIVGPDAHRAILYAQGSVYTELKKWFVKMDDHFNTDLFAPDDKIDNFIISNDVLAPIVEQLSVIDFSILPVRIIGDVYEDYLGEMLRGGKKQGIQVQEDKERQKRKSQGIYYTPEYIVDYINENTIGELLKNAKKAEDIKKIKALDPACGSGSFLINAFDKFYQAYKKAGAVQKLGDFAVKKTILQHNLYGVDLDQRAVEICKLNLFLKALDGAKWEDLKGRKLLPNLELNIRCGNSLISGKSFAEKAKAIPQMVFDFATSYTANRDVVELQKLRKKFYAAKEDNDKKDLLAQIKRDEEIINSKLNDNLREHFSKPAEQKPLNFEVVYPEVFAQGGFDAVIGNPPYGAELKDDFKEFVLNKYEHIGGNTNTGNIFIERGVSLLNGNGKIGLIVPKSICYSDAWLNMRKYLISNLAALIDVSKAFEEVLLEQVILIYDKSGSTNKVFTAKTIGRDFVNKTLVEKKIYLYFDCYLTGLTSQEINIGVKVKNVGNTFNNCCTIKRGQDIQNKIINEKWDIPVYRCKSIGRYILKDAEEGLSKVTYDKLYEQISYMNAPKIIIQNIIAHVTKPNEHIIIMATIDKKGIVSLGSVGNIYITNKTLPEYLIGILNSKLISWYSYRFIYGNAIRTMRFDNYHLNRLPLRIIDFKNHNDKTLHDQLVNFVKEMLALNKTQVLQEKNKIKIAAVDKQIDELVYRLYGLSEAEKKVVEGV